MSITNCETLADVLGHLVLYTGMARGDVRRHTLRLAVMAGDVLSTYDMEFGHRQVAQSLSIGRRQRNVVRPRSGVRSQQ